MIPVFPCTFPPQNTPIVDDQGNMTTPGMAFMRALFNRTGQGSGIVEQVNASVFSNVTLTSDWNYINSGTTTTVTLPAMQGGQYAIVYSAPGTNVIVVAPSGAIIDSGSTYALAGGKMQIFWFFSSTQIVSTQLG